jgi:predicted ferric reductase
MAVIAVALAIGHIEGIGNYSRATWHGRLWLSYSVFWLLLVAYIRIGKPLALRRRPYRVLSVIPEAGAAWTLVLEPQVQPALAFRPGQFAWLTLGRNPFGAKEHPFSFSGSATDRRTLRFTIKELGDFTRTIGRTRVGEIAYVDGPYGVFTTDLHAAAPGFVFIAGGVGIAPIVSILRTLADRGDRRPLVLIYGNWRWDATLFREELEALQQRLPLRIVHVLQEPPVPWTGESGYITEAILRRSLRPVEGHTYTFFLCGPKPMMDFVRPSLHRMKIPLRRIHFEFFEMA